VLTAAELLLNGSHIAKHPRFNSAPTGATVTFEISVILKVPTIPRTCLCLFYIYTV